MLGLISLFYVRGLGGSPSGSAYATQPVSSTAYGPSPALYGSGQAYPGAPSGFVPFRPAGDPYDQRNQPTSGFAGVQPQQSGQANYYAGGFVTNPNVGTGFYPVPPPAMGNYNSNDINYRPVEYNGLIDRRDSSSSSSPSSPSRPLSGPTDFGDTSSPGNGLLSRPSSASSGSSTSTGDNWRPVLNPGGDYSVSNANNNGVSLARPSMATIGANGDSPWRVNGVVTGSGIAGNGAPSTVEYHVVSREDKVDPRYSNGGVMSCFAVPFLVFGFTAVLFTQGILLFLRRPVQEV